MHLTDRRTDRILIAWPRLHSMQRGNKNDVGHFVSIAAVSRYLRASRYQKVSSPQRYWYHLKWVLRYFDSIVVLPNTTAKSGHLLYVSHHCVFVAPLMGRWSMGSRARHSYHKRCSGTHIGLPGRHYCIHLYFTISVATRAGKNLGFYQKFLAFLGF